MSHHQTSISDQIDLANANCASFHARRRDYLRFAIEHILLLLSDRPALIGPKVC